MYLYNRIIHRNVQLVLLKMMTSIKNVLHVKPSDLDMKTKSQKEDARVQYLQVVLMLVVLHLVQVVEVCLLHLHLNLELLPLTKKMQLLPRLHLHLELHSRKKTVLLLRQDLHLEAPL